MENESGIFVLLLDIIRFFRYLLRIVYIICIGAAIYFLGYKILIAHIILGKGIGIQYRWYLDNGILAIAIGVPALILSIVIERFYIKRKLHRQ